jgi:hypothetical protein
MSETNRQVAGTTVDRADFGSSLYLYWVVKIGTETGNQSVNTREIDNHRTTEQDASSRQL